MSFSTSVKREIIKNTGKRSCCRRAMLFGSLLFGRQFSPEMIEYSSEHEDFVLHQKALVQEIFDDRVHPYVIERQNAKGRPVYTMHIVDELDIAAIAEEYGCRENFDNFEISDRLFVCENCRRAFLAGAFLASGYATDPEKEYLLEFVNSKEKALSTLSALLTNYGFPPKCTRRGNDTVLYYKDSRMIEDLLTLFGAPNKALALMNTKIYKEYRNQANRSSNCDIANQEKTTTAGQEQVRDIDYIFSTRGYDYLPENLQEVALLRKLNPESPLSELAALSDLGLSRSGINHRLTKIRAIAKKLREEELQA